jgi:hypothetical protein
MDLHEKFFSDNLKFLKKLHLELENLDFESKKWSGEVALVFTEMLMITFAAYLYRSENLKYKCLITKPKHIPDDVLKSLEKYLEVFRKTSDEDISNFLVDNIPKMSALEDDLRKLTGIY